MDIAVYPNDLLRKKLVVAGIPEQDHTPQGLLARIPTDFQAQAVDHASPDMLAELLLYFLAKGIVILPVPNDQALLDMPWGSHVCQFYHGKGDLLEMLVPYFRQGLERREACVWLVSDLTISEARQALSAAVPGLDRYLGTGQMQIRHYTAFYTNPNGTVKHADILSGQFAAMESSALNAGFKGLRTSGSVSWINNAESMARFMDYETKVNYAIQHSRITAVCTYPARAAAMCRCRELIHNHGKFFVKRGEWTHDMSQHAEKIETVFASLAAM
ncbi:MAG: MEDS domain-containing protein [Pseudomonadota bacterium]